MNHNKLSIAIVVAALILGFAAYETVISHKEYERTVTTKGLSEREFPADIVIWPIKFTESSNSLDNLYTSLDGSAQKVIAFLLERGLSREEFTIGTPYITDKSAQSYGGNPPPEFRFLAHQTISVYSKQVEQVRDIMTQTIELGKQGVLLSGNEYDSKPDYKFTKLNSIKPEMIEEATKNARKVGQKFAEDSNSELGKIKRANQGLFSISPRDKSTPHIKRIRVVSTVEFYLAD